MDALRERFGDRVFRTVIRQSIAYAESAERAIPILDYRPDRGADYLSLAGEMLRRLGRQDLLERLDELCAEVVPAGARAGCHGSRHGRAPSRGPGEPMPVGIGEYRLAMATVIRASSACGLEDTI